MIFFLEVVNIIMTFNELQIQDEPVSKLITIISSPSLSENMKYNIEFRQFEKTSFRWIFTSNFYFNQM